MQMTSPTISQTDVELKVAVFEAEARQVGLEEKPTSKELELRRHNLLSLFEALLEENYRLRELLENRND